MENYNAFFLNLWFNLLLIFVFNVFFRHFSEEVLK